MPLREDILAPIPGDNPSGIDLRYDTKFLIYDKIKEARRRDDDLAQGAWQSERKTANYPVVIKLAEDSLATVSVRHCCRQRALQGCDRDSNLLTA
jgi:type VI secretion system protein ImpA